MRLLHMKTNFKVLVKYKTLSNNIKTFYSNFFTVLSGINWLRRLLSTYWHFLPGNEVKKTLMSLTILMLHSMTWVFTEKYFNAVGGNYRSFLRTRIPFFRFQMHSMQRTQEKRFSSPHCILISSPAPWMWVRSYVLSANSDLSADGNVTGSFLLQPFSKHKKLSLG